MSRYASNIITAVRLVFGKSKICSFGIHCQGESNDFRTKRSCQEMNEVIWGEMAFPWWRMNCGAARYCCMWQRICPWVKRCRGHGRHCLRQQPWLWASLGLRGGNLWSWGERPEGSFSALRRQENPPVCGEVAGQRIQPQGPGARPWAERGGSGYRSEVRVAAMATMGEKFVQGSPSRSSMLGIHFSHRINANKYSLK